MSADSNATGLSPFNPTKYLGPNVSLCCVVARNRSPTPADYRQPETGKLYTISTWWIVGKNPTDGVQGDLWYLSKIVGNVAYWLQFTGGGGGGGNPLMLTVDNVSGTGVNPVIQTPGGGMTFRGTTSANYGTPVRTQSTAAFVYDLMIQRAFTSAVPNANLCGLAHFNSAQFSVDVNGFVSSIANNIQRLQVDAFEAPATTVDVLPAVNGTIAITGELVNQNANPIRTLTKAANQVNIQAQIAGIAVAGNRALNGMCHFDSAVFNVSADGFVTTIGGGAGIERVAVQAASGGPNPVSPAGGTITLNGLQVAQSGTAVQSITRAPNTVNVEVQRADVSIGSNISKNGLCHFNSNDFSIDANGFVSSGGIGNIKQITVNNVSGGTNPVLPVGGNVNLNGALVAQSGVPIQTISRAANSINIENQVATTSGASNVTRNGLAHFNSSDFMVDANGFVSSIASVGPNPGAIVTLKDDFLFLGVNGGSGGNTSFGELDWTITPQGPFVTGVVPGTAQLNPDHPGVAVSSNIISNCAVLLGGWKKNNITIGGGALTVVWVVYISTLSNGVQPYELRLGMGDTLSLSVSDPQNLQSNAIYFNYTHTVNAGNWNLVTINNGATTTTPTAVPATTGWHVFRLDVNAAGTSVVFTLDGVPFAPVVSNLPTGPITGYYSLVVPGTTTSYPVGLIQIDLFYLRLALTNPRF